MNVIPLPPDNVILRGIQEYHAANHDYPFDHPELDDFVRNWLNSTVEPARVAMRIELLQEEYQFGARPGPLSSQEDQEKFRMCDEIWGGIDEYELSEEDVESDFIPLPPDNAILCSMRAYKAAYGVYPNHSARRLSHFVRNWLYSDADPADVGHRIFLLEEQYKDSLQNENPRPGPSSSREVLLRFIMSEDIWGTRDDIYPYGGQVNGNASGRRNDVFPHVGQVNGNASGTRNDVYQNGGQLNGNASSSDEESELSSSDEDSELSSDESEESELSSDESNG